MNFLHTKTRLQQFYTNFKQTTSSIMKKYTLHDLNNIAKDIELALPPTKFTKYARDTDEAKQMISVIQHLIKSWTTSDKKKIKELMEQGPSKKKARETKHTPTKPASSSVSLKTQAREEGLLATGSKSELTQRLHRCQTDTLHIEDMSTESMRNELTKEKMLIPRSRDQMIILLRRGDNDQLELGDFTDEVVDHYWDEMGLPNKRKLSRDKKLTQLRILQIQNLKKMVRKLDQRLASCQKRPSKVITRHHHRQTGQSWTSSLAQGVFQGAVAGIVSNAVSRRLQRKSKLVF